MVAGRFRGLVGLAWQRVTGRLQIAPSRVVLSVVGVGLAVGLMVTVTGVSLGLASQSVVESDDVDYWIVPEEADVQSVAISSEGVRLGAVHETSHSISRDDRVEYATPVLLEIVPIRDATTGDRRYVLAAGIVPGGATDVFGVNTTELTPGDAYYGEGGYTGHWTGEVVLNDAATTVTNTSRGSQLHIVGNATNQSFSVVAVSDGGTETAAGTVPMAVMHLSELQELTGATQGDTADQILVQTNDPAVREQLAGRYPRTTVITRQGLVAPQVSTTSLSLAIAVAVLISAVVVGVLFVTTLMGLEVSADRKQLGTLHALGISARSVSLVVACETLLVSLIGGGIGIAFGWLGILGVNRLGVESFGVDTVASFHPALIGYGLLVAVGIGIVGGIYPVLLSRRTDPLEVLSG